MKINIQESTIEKLIEYLAGQKGIEAEYSERGTEATKLLDQLKDEYRGFKEIIKESNRYQGAAAATQARQNSVKEKIDNFLNLWKFEGNKDLPTPYKLSKGAGISFVTARKYLNSISENS
jgi:hypothetical protein